MVDRLLDRTKAPTSKRRYVGIEIEFLIPRGDAYTKLEKLLYKNELQWNVNLGDDGSVEDTDFVPQYITEGNGWNPERRVINYMDKKQGHEIRILAEEDDAPAIVRKTCEIIAKCGGMVNKTCGLHVHVDMRSRDYKKVYSNLFFVQNLMFSMQPSERKSSKYCKKLPHPIKGPSGSRYWSINKRAYDEHRTLEIRLHEGCIDANDILAWTGFLIAMANLETVLDKQTDIDELPFPDKLKEYVHERVNRFSKSKGKNTITA